jgi:uncharacterized protein (TIGR00290 family)
MGKPKAWMAWSSGKDSAWALHLAQRGNGVDVIGLLTTISDSYRRVSMHGVREELLEAQRDALGLPLYAVRIPTPCPNDTYEAAMGSVLETARAEGVTHIVFGDLFLEDVRSYREAQLARVGMFGHFPLWGRETGVLAREMIAGGLRAYLTCVDPRRVSRELAGRAFDEALLSALPEGADPCGENGEFHTFAWDGPMFTAPIPVQAGDTVERDGFVFTDLVRAEPAVLSATP